MKTSEIKELGLEDLKERVQQQSELYMKMKMNNKISTLENPLSVKYVRRTVARLKTELNARLKAEKK